jgi:hypothetical protein
MMIMTTLMTTFIFVLAAEGEAARDTAINSIDNGGECE